MSIKTELLDGKGKGYTAKVNEGGELSVIVHPHPPTEASAVALPFRSYFKNSSGATDMRVNGATTAVPFYIEAVADRDIYINSISVVISDASATLSGFGNLSALTNGVQFYWESKDNGTITIHEGLKTNFQFIRLASGRPAFGDGATAFRANNISGASEGYMAFIDLSDIFGLDWGVRLRKGTTDKLVFSVRDNLTGVDQFDIIGYGVQL